MKTLLFDGWPDLDSEYSTPMDQSDHLYASHGRVRVHVWLEGHDKVVAFHALRWGDGSHLNPYYARRLKAQFDRLKPEAQDAIHALLPEWDGAYGTLVEVARKL